MSFRNRSGFPSRRPLPTISESPSTSGSSPNTTQPSTSPSATSSIPWHPSYVRSKSLPLVPKRLIGTGKPSGTSSNAAAAAGMLKQPLVKQRTSKTSQKHVQLPTSVQDAPLPSVIESPVAEDVTDDAGGEGVGYEAQYGERVLGEESINGKGRRWRQTQEDQGGAAETDMGTSQRTIGEQLSSDQRDEMGYQRLTAYYCCEEFKMGLLSTFLKREHAVSPRFYDDAIYSLYHLPLLPGYQPSVNVRSSITDKSAEAKLVLSLITEAEESGYHEAYFPSSPMGSVGGGSGTSTPVQRDGFIDTFLPPATSLTTLLANKALKRSAAALGIDTKPTHPPHSAKHKRRFPRAHIAQRRLLGVDDHPVAEAIFFRYGVAVFFGFSRRDELDILDDLIKQGIMVGEKKNGEKKNYETESFHFEYDPSASTPRIFNDFFTFKSPSHLLKLAIAHAIAQSTILATHETAASNLLSSPLTLSIPQQLATSGIIKMRRRVALRLTGQLFQMRQNVNLSSNVLDVPELFWSEASLKGLYDAVREYLEIDERVKALNEKLASVSDLLDVIHDHLNNDAMERITWIIIWLIVVACLVEMGELLARWVLAASSASRLKAQIIANRQAVLQILENAEL